MGTVFRSGNDERKSATNRNRPKANWNLLENRQQWLIMDRNGAIANKTASSRKRKGVINIIGHDLGNGRWAVPVMTAGSCEHILLTKNPHVKSKNPVGHPCKLATALRNIWIPGVGPSGRVDWPARLRISARRVHRG